MTHSHTASADTSRLDTPVRWSIESRVDDAGVTQLVECDLAKVDVAGSNPVSRSIPMTGVSPVGLLDGVRGSEARAHPERSEQFLSRTGSSFRAR